jgi:hypothetical protein
VSNRETFWANAFLSKTEQERKTKGVMEDMIFKNSVIYADECLIAFDIKFKKGKK